MGNLTRHRASMGDAFQIKVALHDVLILASAEGAKHVLQSNNRNYIKDDSYLVLKMLLGNGLLTNEGDSWLRQRRLAQPAFYKESLREIIRTMGEVALGFAERIAKNKGSTTAIDMNRELMSVTLDIALRSLFTYSMAGTTGELYDAMHYLQEYVIVRIREPYRIPLMYFTGGHRKFRLHKSKLDQLVLSVIQRRMDSDEHLPDLLGMFMAARDEETGERMSPQQLLDESLTMIAAGHETSANALSWALYALSAEPEICAKVKEEADRIIGNGQIPTFEQIGEMHYTRMVVEEAMRLHPPAWIIGRKAIADDEADGWAIPKERIVLVPVFMIHRDERYWENPERFVPERFAPEAVKARHKFAYLPFGGGPRMCIGYQFALMEMQLLLGMLLQRARFELDPSHKVIQQPLVTLKPKTGVMMFVK